MALVKDEPLVLVTKNGYVLKFKSTDVSASSRMTIGVKGINLSEGDYVVAALPVHDENDSLALFTANGMAKKIAPSDLITQNRGGKGVICYKGNSYVAAASLINDEDIILICGDKNNICVNATDVPTLGRATQGNAVLKGNRIVSVTKAS